MFDFSADTLPKFFFFSNYRSNQQNTALLLHRYRSKGLFRKVKQYMEVDSLRPLNSLETETIVVIKARLHSKFVFVVTSHIFLMFAN